MPSFKALDWLVREYVPAWFDLVPRLKSFAKELRSLDEILEMTPEVETRVRAAAAAARVVAKRARARGANDAAGSSAWTAAWDAAGEVGVLGAARLAGGELALIAADAAADAAATAAVGPARKAAGRAPWDATWESAKDTVWPKAIAAAREALEPTSKRLQSSAVNMVVRMIENP